MKFITVSSCFRQLSEEDIIWLMLLFVKPSRSQERAIRLSLANAMICKSFLNDCSYKFLIPLIAVVYANSGVTLPFFFPVLSVQQFYWTFYNSKWIPLVPRWKLGYLTEERQCQRFRMLLDLRKMINTARVLMIGFLVSMWKGPEPLAGDIGTESRWEIPVS